MPDRKRRRTLLWALFAAAIIGFAVGWYASVWYRPSPESRARDAAEQIRERVRRLTH